VKLTAVEYRLLYHLVRNRRAADAPTRHCWTGSGVASTRATTDDLKVFISRLRAKLEPRGQHTCIETETRIGIPFSSPPGGSRQAPRPQRTVPHDPDPFRSVYLLLTFCNLHLYLWVLGFGRCLIVPDAH